MNSSDPIELYLKRKALRWWKQQPRCADLRNGIFEAGLFEPAGAFRHVLPADVPAMIAAHREDGRIVAYAMLFACSNRCFGYMPERTGLESLGVVGVYVAPEHRARGFARKCLSELGARLPTGLFYVLTERRILPLVRSAIATIAIPRWACEQPSRFDLQAISHRLSRPEIYGVAPDVRFYLEQRNAA